jgi:hypothetical protein
MNYTPIMNSTEATIKAMESRDAAWPVGMKVTTQTRKGTVSGQAPTTHGLMIVVDLDEGFYSEDRETWISSILVHVDNLARDVSRDDLRTGDKVWDDLTEEWATVADTRPGRYGPDQEVRLRRLAFSELGGWIVAEGLIHESQKHLIDRNDQ